MPNTKRGFWNVRLILVILLILGGGAYLWSQKKIEAPANVPADNSFKTLPAPTSDTSNWKTYRSEKYGFEFRYPALNHVTTSSYGDGISAEVILSTNENRKDDSTREVLINVTSMNSNTDNCSLLSPSGKIYRTINDIHWQYIQDGIYGMRTFGQVRKYKIAHNISCFGITLMISGPRYYGGDRDGSGDLLGRTGATPEFNYETEFFLLDQILSTFRFVK